MSTVEQQAVLTGIKAHYAGIRGLDVSEVIDITDARPTGSTKRRCEGTTRVEFRPDEPGCSDRVYVDRRQPRPTFRTSEDGKRFTVMQDFRSIRAFDGSVSRSFTGYSDGPGTKYNVQEGRITSLPEDISGGWASAVFPVDDWPINRLLNHPSVSGPIEWNGTSVYVVDGYYGTGEKGDEPNNVRFYVDPARGFTMMCSELRRKEGDLAWKTEVRELVKCNDIWLPSRYERSLFLAEGSTTGMGSVKYLRVNPEFSPADFELNWPDGTYVRDEIANIGYKVRDGRPADAQTWQGILDALAADARKPPASDASLQGETPSPHDAGSAEPLLAGQEQTRWRTPLLWALLAVAIGFVGSTAIVLVRYWLRGGK